MGTHLTCASAVSSSIAPTRSTRWHGRQALNVKVAVLAQQTRPTGNTDLEDDFIDLMQRHGYSHKAEGMGGTAVLHTFLNRGETIKNMRCGLMCAD